MISLGISPKPIGFRELIDKLKDLYLNFDLLNLFGIYTLSTRFRKNRHSARYRNGMPYRNHKP